MTTEQESAGERDIVDRLQFCAGPWSDIKLAEDALKEIVNLRLQKAGLEALLCDAQADIGDLNARLAALRNPPIP